MISPLFSACLHLPALAVAAVSTQATPAIVEIPGPAPSRAALVALLLLQLAFGLSGAAVVTGRAVIQLREVRRKSAGKGRAAAVLAALGGVAAWMLLVVSAYELPGSHGVTGVGLDASWPLVIEFASQKGWQFGQDIVYTMGPLGHFFANIGLGGFQTERVVFALSQALFSGYVCWRLGHWMLNPFLLIAFWGWLILLPPTHVLLCAGVAVLVLRAGQRFTLAEVLEMLGVCGGCAILALVKFTNLMAAALVFASIAMIGGLQRHLHRATFALAAFVLIFLIGWAASGQSLGNLAGYFRNSWEITNGYSTMSYAPSPATLAWGLAAATALVIASVACIAPPVGSRFMAAARIAPVLGCAFLSWKHGYTRADGHELLFLSTAFPYACLAAAATVSEEKPPGVHFAWPVWTSRTVAFALLVSVIMLFAGSRPPADYLRSSASKIEETPARIARSFAPSFQLPRGVVNGSRMIDEWQLPEMKRLLGQSTVDVFNYQQAYAFINGLNYLPRPVFQSYSSYTPRLQRMNLDYFRSGKAAEFILFRPETVDGRLSWIDDAPLLLDLLTHCVPVAREKGFLLLAQHGEKSPAGRWTEIGSGEAAWGHAVKLAAPSGTGTLRALRVDARRTAVGKLRQFAYQGSNGHISLKLNDGSKINRLFIPEMASEGFLLSPWMENLDDVLGWQTGLVRPKQVLAFTLSLPTGSEWEFTKKFRYSLMEWTPGGGADAPAAAQAAQLKRLLYPYLPSVPELMQPSMEVRVLEGQEACSARAPTRLEFLIPADAKGLAGRISVECDTGNSPPESVTFRALVLDESGKEIWRHEDTFSPALHREEGGAHKWDLHFPESSAGPSRRLILESSTTASHNRALTWWGPLAWKRQP